MKKLDYSKIISLDDLSKISEDEKNRLITLASIESNKLSSNNISSIISNNRYLSIKEIFNTGLYKDFSEENKKLMATYIMFDSEKIIQFLLSLNIKYDIIKALATKLSELKYIEKLNPNNSIFGSAYLTQIMSVVDKICFLIENEYKTQDDYIIINKLMCIVTFEEELYLKLQQQKVIKPQ